MSEERRSGGVQAEKVGEQTTAMKAGERREDGRFRQDAPPNRGSDGKLQRHGQRRLIGESLLIFDWVQVSDDWREKCAHVMILMNYLNDTLTISPFHPSDIVNNMLKIVATQV